jgi:hypothetical protein
MVLGRSGKTIAQIPVTLSVHLPPTSTSLAHTKTSWTDEELVEQAQQMILKELSSLLQKDLTDRIIGSQLRTLAVEHKSRRPIVTTAKQNGAIVNGTTQESRGLKGLSFRKDKKRPLETDLEPTPEAGTPTIDESQDGATPAPEIDESTILADEPPKKKRKKETAKRTKATMDEDIESQDEDDSTPLAEIVLQKQDAMEGIEEDPQPKKKPKASKATKEKAVAKKKTKAKRVLEQTIVDEIVLPNDMAYDVPQVTSVHVTPEVESPFPVTSADHVQPSRPVSRSPSPIPDPFAEGVCQDDEDLYYAKLALMQLTGETPSPLVSTIPLPSSPSEPKPFRKHITGSARTEGYYKITHAEKAAYVAQYAVRGNIDTASSRTVEVAPATQHVTSSRSNRANARRRALGLEEINQVQRAVALSKGETAAAELSFKFNQLQTRKKHLRFARSPIHDWGLYAMERISRGEMVIEYVGEVIRAAVADKREKAYERQGIGSSYLFRIDEDLVVDATKKGNLGCVVFLLQFVLYLY